MTNSYCINWKSQETHILQGLRTLFEPSGFLLTDVTLACDGEYIKAHKLVLSLCSSFFRDLFQKNRADVSNTIVIVSNISACNMRHLLRFMYEGKVLIPKKQIDNFLKAGRLLKIEGIDGSTDWGHNEDEDSALSDNPHRFRPQAPSRSKKQLKRKRVSDEGISNALNIVSDHDNYNGNEETSDTILVKTENVDRQLKDHDEEEFGTNERTGFENSKDTNDELVTAIAKKKGNSAGCKEVKRKKPFTDVDESEGSSQEDCSYINDNDSNAFISKSAPTARPNSSNKTVRRRKRRSAAWPFFKPNSSGTSAQCKLCSDVRMIPTTRGGTTGLLAHLTAFHPGVLQQKCSTPVDGK